MNESAVQFPFVEMDAAAGVFSRMPLLTFILSHQSKSINVSGLLDTGVAINELPHAVGTQLGAV